MVSLSSGQHHFRWNIYLRWQVHLRWHHLPQMALSISSDKYLIGDIIYPRWHHLLQVTSSTLDILSSLKGANFLGDNFYIRGWSRPQVTSSFLGDIAQSFTHYFPCQGKEGGHERLSPCLLPADSVSMPALSKLLPSLVLDWTIEKWFSKENRFV